MTQTPSAAPLHTFGEEMPLPMRGASFLVEIEYETVQSSLILLEDETQLNVATVRAASPLVPGPVLEVVLPDGNGSVGRKVVTGDAQFQLLTAADYALFGLEEPTDENGLRLLGFLNLNRVVAVIPADGQAVPAAAGFLPFVPLGERVFLEFDKSDVAPLFHEGEVNVEAVERTESGLYVPEQALAAENNIATVIGLGAGASGVAVGDRVVAPKQEGSVEYGGRTYYYVGRPSALVCKVGANEALAAAAAPSKYAEGDALTEVADLSAVDCRSPELCRTVGCQDECLASIEDDFADPVTGLTAGDFAGGRADGELPGQTRLDLDGAAGGDRAQ